MTSNKAFVRMQSNSARSGEIIANINIFCIFSGIRIIL